MENLIEILENTLSHRHNIWMFYTVIVTTVFGMAFSDAYRSLTVLPRIVLTTAVGLAVWYNYYAIITNTAFIHQLVDSIRAQLEPGAPLYDVFHSPLPNRYNPPDIELVQYMYFFVNLAIGFAMWWDEVVLFGKWLKKKIDRMPD